MKKEDEFMKLFSQIFGELRGVVTCVDTNPNQPIPATQIGILDDDFVVDSGIYTENVISNVIKVDFTNKRRL